MNRNTHQCLTPRACLHMKEGPALSANHEHDNDEDDDEEDNDNDDNDNEQSSTC